MLFIIADKQEVTRYAVECILQDVGDVSVRHADSPSALEEAIPANQQCAIVLDYATSDFADVNALTDLASRYPRSRWLLFSESLTEQFLRIVVLKSQQFSVVFKDAPLHEVVEAISSVLRGQRFISMRVTETLLQGGAMPTGKQSPLLTPTEISIVKAIAEGKTTREIALERDLSFHTVNTHRKNIFRKLGVNTAIEAICKARLKGYIES